MFKNQLQELAQRSCFNLPSYSSVREGPDHAPRFKATVTFNGETFESPGFSHSLRQAEHAASEVALNTLSKRGPTQSLPSRILDETGFCKNMLQEAAQKADIRMPIYSANRLGPSHSSSFVCTVQVAGKSFVGEPAKTKKQAEKNAATSAWASLKNSVIQGSTSSVYSDSSKFHRTKEQLQAAIVRILKNMGQDNESQGSKSVEIQDSPSPRGSVLTSRIRITPFKHQPCQESVKMSDGQDMLTFASQIKKTHCEEQHVPETPPKVFVTMSSGSKTENISQAQLDTGGSSQSTIYKGVADTPISEDKMLVHGSPTLVQQKFANPQTIATTPHYQNTYIPVNHLEPHAKQSMLNDGSPVKIVEDKSIGSPDSVLPVVHHGYTPVLWNSGSHQCISTGAANIPVGSLVPIVHVYLAIPLCSPCTSGKKDQENPSTMATALQGLSNLKL